jgi:hypothetical protein
MFDPDVAAGIPLKLKSGEVAGHVRVANGTLSADQIGNLVTVRAANVNMSGPGAKAVLLHIPTFVPPVRFELDAIEPHPELEMLVIGHAEATFHSADNVDVVDVQTSDGLKQVPVTQF